MSDNEGIFEDSDDDFLSEDFNSFGGMNTDGVDSEEIGSGVVKVTKPGAYHFVISTAKPRPKPYVDNDYSKLRKPDILLACTVVGTDHGQSGEGAVYYHNLVVGGKGPGTQIADVDRSRTLNFLVGVGVLHKRDGKVIDPKTGTTEIELNTLATRLQGMQFVGCIELTKGQMKDDGTKWEDRLELPWGRGAFPVDHPSVSGVKKNEQWLAKIGKQHAAGPPSNGHAKSDSQKSGAGTSAAPQSKQAAPVGADV